MRTVGLGVLGLGTVGGGLARLLDLRAADLERRGLAFHVARAAVSDRAKPRPVPRDRLASIDAVVDDPDVEIVVELMGGVDVARRAILQALHAGKHVVTANKAVLAHHGEELFAAAAANDAHLGIEASVCAGVPLLHALGSGLAGVSIRRITGVVNGTSSFVLGRMEQGLGFDAALDVARSCGFAEADPSLDVSGLDAVHKLIVLTALAFGRWESVDSVGRTSIEHLDVADFRWAHEHGWTLRPVIEAASGPAGLWMSAGPALVARDGPLATATNGETAVVLGTDVAGDVTLTGKGAGGLPTASAVLADLVRIAEGRRGATPRSTTSIRQRAHDRVVPFALRLPVQDRPGELGRITTLLGAHDLSVASADATSRDGRGCLRILLHPASERRVRRAVAELPDHDEVLILPVLGTGTRM